LATGWTTEESQFESRKGEKFSLPHIVQISSGDHPASYPMEPWDLFLGDIGRGVKLTTHLELMPSLRKSNLYAHSTIRLHGIDLN
jgi:hypothetical protein